MINRRRLYSKIWIMCRLVIALAGLFALFYFDGLKIRELVADVKDDSALISISGHEVNGEDSVIDLAEGQIDAKGETGGATSNSSGSSVSENLIRSYTVKINELTFSLASQEEIITLLSEAKKRYDTKDEYEVRLVKDYGRQLPVITAKIYKRDGSDTWNLSGTSFADSGVGKYLSQIGTIGTDGKDGLKSLEFGDTVEVAEAYVPRTALTPLDEAINTITQEKQKEVLYEVQPGDSLSLIALVNDISMEELIDINPSLENENSIVRIGDELTITVPEPELSFVRIEQQYYEENYEGEIEYVDNDDWYTTDEETLQDPIAGFHKVVADIEYLNDREINRTIIHEEIVAEATPKIVEKGTKIPPTYYKPISGGWQSSGFGKRNAPTKGASTYHKGIDWATPIGTAVMASASGTVSRAGWGSGYGNVVYIDHADGRQTRYGHLSKVLVKAGQHVNQGEKIALSGNTGRSTGAHLHFEILINGSQVNPLSYLN